MKVQGKATNRTQELESQKVKSDKKLSTGKDRSMNEVGDFSSSAQVSLSNKAQDAKKAREVVDQVPDVDEARVAYFQKLIDAGEYKTDAQAIADKLVDEHLTYPN